jgi:hypothetical protein
MTIDTYKEIRLAQVRSSIAMKAVCVVRTKASGCTIASLDRLLTIARRDFPQLQDEDVRVVHFGGQSRKGTWGIEFDCPGNPSVASIAGWVPIPELETPL